MCVSESNKLATRERLGIVRPRAEHTRTFDAAENVVVAWCLERETADQDAPREVIAFRYR